MIRSARAAAASASALAFAAASSSALAFAAASAAASASALVAFAAASSSALAFAAASVFTISAGTDAAPACVPAAGPAVATTSVPAPSPLVLARLASGSAPCSDVGPACSSTRALSGISSPASTGGPGTDGSPSPCPGLQAWPARSRGGHGVAAANAYAVAARSVAQQQDRHASHKHA